MSSDDFWNKRYADEDYIYGTAPNDFLRANVNQLKKGRVLCLAEGEGRNAVYLAEQGFDVTALDSSSVGLEKAQALAAKKNVSITTVCADLNEYQFAESSWDSIVAIFMHLPKALRSTVYASVQKALVADGVFLTEVYRPAQLGYGTGGPSDVNMLVSLDDVQTKMTALKPVFAQETMREVLEGTGHTGNAAVTQFIGKR